MGSCPKKEREKEKKKDGESHARAAADDTGSCSQIDWAKNSKYIRGEGGGGRVVEGLPVPT